MINLTRKMTVFRPLPLALGIALGLFTCGLLQAQDNPFAQPADANADAETEQAEAPAAAEPAAAPAGAQPAPAPETAPAGEEAVDVEVMTDPTDAMEVATADLTFGEMFEVGGWVMWPLLVCSIALIALTLYNLLAIRASRLLQPEVVKNVEDAVGRLDLEEATRLCDERPSPMTNILKAGLSRGTRGEVDIMMIEKGMEEASPGETASVLLPINYISVVAVITPMLGLLGTVSGMISAFRRMALSGMGRPELFADSISEALITTASGLVIGIPAMVIFFFFKYRYTAIISDISRQAGNVLKTLRESMTYYQEHGELPPRVDAADDDESLNDIRNIGAES
jgi:biopolymer transport protein ExbB